MTWRVARSLDQLLAQLNALALNRSRVSDGSIGDAAHQNQGSASDHNPWYGPGIVTARDFTHDPANGLDCSKLAAALIASRDPRIKYIIWQGRICDSRAQFNPWTWQPSSGHYQHLHLSVMANATADDSRPWVLPGLTQEADMTPDESNRLTAVFDAVFKGGASTPGKRSLLDIAAGAEAQAKLAATRATPVAMTAEDRSAIIAALVPALADELDRRARDGDPKTGPTS